jgi:hypothetical protein
MISRACLSTNGRFASDDVKKWLDEGSWQLWVAEKDGAICALCTTEILIYPRLKVCRVNMVTGKGRKLWQEFNVKIEYWAKEQGCQIIESLARKGWARIYKDYQQSHVFLEKKL